MPFNFLNQGQTDDTATKFQPIDTFIDPVSKIRVSNPANLIDTDFEYGLQPTKWETVEIINNTPAFFSKSGDTTISDITGVTTNGGTREITVTTAFPHLLAVGIPIRVSGTKSVTADGSYIINATPTPTTFTYLARANQPETISIFDLYTSIITGEFFQGSQISISDAEGMTTDGVGPFSTITIKTANKHGFGPKTPFYFLNLNSTVSKEFESTNSTSLSFDPTNSATAQAFDGSNTLLQTAIDLSNSATTSQAQSSITSTNSTDATVTVSIAQGDEGNWANLNNGDPLYYDVNVGSGYFQANPRGVVFIKDVSLVDATNGTAVFQVSQVPDGDPIPVLANMTGFFQIADQARTFAGNNVNPETQIDLNVEIGQSYGFDGANQGYVGTSEDFLGSPPSNEGTVIGYTGTNISLFTAEGELDYYVGAMVLYTTSTTAASGLSDNTTYFVTSFSQGASAGLFNMSIAETPGGDPITVSGGEGTQTFNRIGVSLDKNIIHVRESFFEEGDMLEYTYPNDGTPGNFGADEEKKFYFVQTAYDEHNYLLSAELFTPIRATGGNVITEIDAEGRTWKVHQFTSTGTSDFVVESTGSEAKLEYLIVAGGGGGGGRHAGAGGAGGMLTGDQTSVTPGTYPIVVGDGGLGNTSDGRGAQGQNSSAFGLTAIGGGGGGSWGNQDAGGSGGSGGGGTDGFPGGSGTSGQGNNGGNSPGRDNNQAGGGGGGGAAQAGRSSYPAHGGDGRVSSILGTSYYFAGGGGGGCWTPSSPPPGDGGLGGGGGGGKADSGSVGSGDTNGLNPGGDGNAGRPNAKGGSGGANTGGGGGGGGATSPNSGYTTTLYGGGNGGSGIVVIRYPLTEVPIPGITATGGTITEVVDGRTVYNVHSFTTVGQDNFVIQAIEKPEFASVEYLIVAGGGGGGGRHGGGGGAGGMLTGEQSDLQVASYTVTVGGGGEGRTFDNRGDNGGNSTAFGLTAIGGGGGGSWGGTDTGAGGGSGGGGSDGRSGGAGTSGQGNRGGNGPGRTNSQASGGGGGGAGAAGSSGHPPHGGVGRQSTMFGTPYYFAGGGGGGAWEPTTPPAGDGGLGGGGGGGKSLRGSAGSGGGQALNPGGNGNVGRPNAKGGSGGANTGGGGGGGGATSPNNGYTTTLYGGGNGGSGIVVIRYITGTQD